MKRLSATLAALLVVVATAGAPVALASDGSGEVLSGPVQEAAGIVGMATPSDVARYDGHPSMVVEVSDGDMSALDEWANGSAEREVIARFGENDTLAVVAAPVDDLGVSFVDRLLNTGLASKSYVEHVSFNLVVELDPVGGLDKNTSYERPRGARWVELRSEGEFTADGQAWRNDTERSTLADARAAIGVDEVSQNGSGITVAVLDTGLNADKTSDRLFQNRTRDPYNAITETKGYDAVETSTDHGPWVAAAIGADAPNDSYDGVAPGATIMPVKVLDEDGSGTVASIVRGLEWSENHDADVVSLSLGSPTYSEVLADAIRDALDGNVTAVVVAVGNSKQNPAVRYISSPADVDGVIGVAATNVSEPSTAAPAYFSEVGPDDGGRDLSGGVTRGEGPDVAAPGMRIVAPLISDTSSRENVSLSGTSMATPLVSGVVALVLEANPELVNETNATRGYMLNTSTPIPAAGVTEVGEGMVDAANATALSANPYDQTDARDDLATARDAANHAYAGSLLRPRAEG